MQRYKDSADFYGLFEAGTFDKEVRDGFTFTGYVYDEDGELIVAAEFLHDATGEGGVGSWDASVI